MITVQEAYLKAVSLDPEGRAFLHFCRDFGDFWMFVFGRGPQDMMFGSGTQVFKETGEVVIRGAGGFLGSSVDVPVEQVIGDHEPPATATA